MSLILAGNFSAALKPIFNRVIDDGKEAPAVYKQIYEILASNDGYELDIVFPGFSLPAVLTESQGSRYESVSQGYQVRYDHIEYQNGYMCSEIAMSDIKLPGKVERWTKQLLKGMQEGKETIAAGVLNGAFSGDTLADGVTLASASHPNKVGTYSNTPIVQADLSEAALEQAFKDIRLITNEAGLLAHLKPMKLIVHSENIFDARRILHSDLRSNTANNDLNALRMMGILQSEPIVCDYLTTTTHWFIQTDADQGLTMYQNLPVEVRTSNDFDHNAMKVSAIERYCVGISNARALYCCQGTV